MLRTEIEEMRGLLGLFGFLGDILVLGTLFLYDSALSKSLFSPSAFSLDCVWPRKIEFWLSAWG